MLKTPLLLSKRISRKSPKHVSIQVQGDESINIITHKEIPRNLEM